MSVETRLPHVYADAGLVEAGYTWGGAVAWCVVDADGRAVATWSRPVLAADLGLDVVENNCLETYALLLALEHMPERWDGTAHTDCLNALRRLATPERTKYGGCPDWMRERCVAARAARPAARFELMAGHPTARQLATGVKKGKPVSVHQVWCDEACGRACAGLRAARAAATPGTR